MLNAGRAFHMAGAPDAAHRLADALDAALPALARHLDDEEDIVIPLLALKGEGIG